jgi:hypothetical protein
MVRLGKEHFNQASLKTIHMSKSLAKFEFPIVSPVQTILNLSNHITYL